MYRPGQHAYLATGQTLQLRVPSGARLLCLRGRLLVRGAPRWLAEQMLTHPLALHEGECLQADSTGWMSMEALGDAELVLLPPAPGMLQGLLDRLGSALRRHIGGTGGAGDANGPGGHLPAGTTDSDYDVGPLHRHRVPCSTILRNS